MGCEDWPEAFVLVDRNDKGAFSIRFDPDNSEERNTEIALDMLVRGNIDKSKIIETRNGKGNYKDSARIDLDHISEALIGFLEGEICLGCIEKIPEIGGRYEFGLSLKSDSD